MFRQRCRQHCDTEQLAELTHRHTSEQHHHEDYDAKQKRRREILEHDERNDEDADSYLDTFNWERKYNPIVAFRDVDLKNIKKTKKIENLELRKENENEKLLEYYHKTDVKNFKAKLVTCPTCESKINKEYINNCTCPLCRTDLRSETTKKTIERYESNIEKLEEEIKKENKKLIKKVKDKAPIKYLLLFEEYCG